MIIYKNCKHILPCGWCELRKMMCTANEPFVIEYHDDKPSVLNCAVECKEESDERDYSR